MMGKRPKVLAISSGGGHWVQLLRLRPDVVVTTGAAPGHFGLRFCKLLGARVIWLVGIANTEDLSLFGQ